MPDARAVRSQDRLVTMTFSRAMAPLIVWALRAGASATTSKNDAQWLNDFADDVAGDE